jgi:hypothetical protein
MSTNSCFSVDAISDDDFIFLSEKYPSVGFSSVIALINKSVAGIKNITTFTDEKNNGKWEIAQLHWDSIFVDYFTKTERIISYEFSGTDYRTLRGMTVGSTKEQIIRKYGKPYSEDDTYLSYMYNLNKYDEPPLVLAFYLEKGIVKKIRCYMATD